MLSTIVLTVNALTDDPIAPIPGQTTLRDAIIQAGTGNQYVINFSVEGTINLTSALPPVANNISIEGPGVSNLTVEPGSGAPAFSVFTVDSTATVSICVVTISGWVHSFENLKRRRAHEHSTR
jgi:hypothetical protein